MPLPECVCVCVCVWEREKVLLQNKTQFDLLHWPVKLGCKAAPLFIPIMASFPLSSSTFPRHQSCALLYAYMYMVKGGNKWEPKTDNDEENVWGIKEKKGQPLPHIGTQAEVFCDSSGRICYLNRRSNTRSWVFRSSKASLNGPWSNENGF